MRRYAIVPAIALVLGLAAAPSVTWAQEEGPGPITWIAHSTVKSGKTQDAVALTLRDREFYDDLLENGTILSWGLATPINHRPGDKSNFAMWVTAAGWEEIDAWADAFQRHTAGFDEAEQKERQKLSEATHEPRSHWDSVVRHRVFRPGAEGAAPPRYFYFSYFTARAGQETAAVDLFKDFVAPVADELREDGVLASFGMYTSELHGDRGWTHVGWYAFPGLAGIDRLQAGFGGAMNPGVLARYRAVFDPETHRDEVWRVLHAGGRPAP